MVAFSPRGLLTLFLILGRRPVVSLVSDGHDVVFAPSQRPDPCDWWPGLPYASLTHYLLDEKGDVEEILKAGVHYDSNLITYFRRWVAYDALVVWRHLHKIPYFPGEMASSSASVQRQLQHLCVATQVSFVSVQCQYCLSSYSVSEYYVLPLINHGPPTTCFRRKRWMHPSKSINKVWIC